MTVLHLCFETPSEAGIPFSSRAKTVACPSPSFKDSSGEALAILARKSSSAQFSPRGMKT